VSRRAVDIAVAVGLAAAGFAVIVIPAVAMRWEVLEAGVGSMDDDILLASILVGLAHVALAWRRLRDEERMAGPRAHLWIASLNALVVLALSASLLLLAVLISFPDEHLTLGHRGFPFVTMWGALQLIAVALAEAAARLTFWWLDAGPMPQSGR
jgi:hypothetical protein